jgi:hypothetical protein
VRSQERGLAAGCGNGAFVGPTVARNQARSKLLLPDTCETHGHKHLGRSVLLRSSPAAALDAPAGPTRSTRGQQQTKKRLAVPAPPARHGLHLARSR